MSFWTKLRDAGETAGVLVGNYYLPGSSLVTSKLTSEGSQKQLSSTPGQLAQLGSGGYGISQGTLGNYGNIANSLGFGGGGATTSATAPAAGGATATGGASGADLVSGGGLFGGPGSAFGTPGVSSGVTGVGSSGIPMANAGLGAGGAGGASTAAAGGGGIMDYLKSGVSALGGLGNIANVGGNLLSGYMGSQASKQAAQTQAEAQQRALDLQREIYQSQLGLQQPFREAGLTAQNRMLDLLGLSANKAAPGYGTMAQDFGQQQFQADPGYAFRLAEGQKALERSAAARGGLLSGAALKGAQRYGQDLASQEYQNAFNRYQAERSAKLQPLASLAAAGQGAAGALSNVAGAYGQQAGAGMTDIGRAQAAGQMGAVNALTGGISGALQGYQNQQIVDALRRSQYTPYGTV